MEVPHKFKVVLWRICKTNLHVHNLLRGRGMATIILCPMCEVDVEHLLHIFLDYTFAKHWWRLMGLNFDGSSVESASEWLLGCLVRETKETRVKIDTGF